MVGAIADIGVFFAVAVFLLGASIGSFLNVVIYRLPAGLSLVRPASRCPSCETPIKARHNLPVLGWLALRGRCATCRVAISPRYPLIELAMGLLAVGLFHALSGGLLTPELIASDRFLLDVVGPFVLYLVFVAALVAITFIDLDWFIIPDVISLPGIPLGICVTVAAGHTLGVEWPDALIGAGVGAGSILAIIVGYGALTGKEGMGGGDWKLLAMIGAWLGWQVLPVVLLLSSLQGIILVLLFQRRFAVDTLPPEPGDDAPPVVAAGAGAPRWGELAIPFGPFLSLAALEILFFKPELEALQRWLLWST